MMVSQQVCPAPGRFGYEGDTREVAQSLAVELEDLPLALHLLFKHQEQAAVALFPNLYQPEGFQ